MANLNELFRQAAVYVDKVLSGRPECSASPSRRRCVYEPIG